MAVKFSFPRICIALGISDPTQLLEHASREAEASESVSRVPAGLSGPAGEGRRRHSDRSRSAIPVALILATCRRHQNHGQFNGGIDDQIRILEAALDAGARPWMWRSRPPSWPCERLRRLRRSAKLIVSYHNFENTPHLDQVVKRMTRIPADAYKIVTTARKPSDCARILALARVESAGPDGGAGDGRDRFRHARALPVVWRPLHLRRAELSPKEPPPARSAPTICATSTGSTSFRKVSKVYGVIADPVRHSISPAVHNRAFQARRLDSVYLPFLVAPAHSRTSWNLAAALPIAGFSVTIPHKQRIMRYLDVVDPLARRIGAVNTVWRKAGKWRGANTDAAGVTVPLSRHLRPAKVDAC